jgi:hypothetical protein
MSMATRRTLRDTSPSRAQVNSPGRWPAATDDRPTQRRPRYHSSPALVGATPTVAGAFRRVRNSIVARTLSIHTSWMGPPTPLVPHPSSGTHWTSAPARHDVGALSFSPPPAPIALLPHRPPSGIRGAMAHARQRLPDHRRQPEPPSKPTSRRGLPTRWLSCSGSTTSTPARSRCACGGISISRGALRRRPPTRRRCPPTTGSRLRICCGSGDISPRLGRSWFRYIVAAALTAPSRRGR